MKNVSDDKNGPAQALQFFKVKDVQFFKVKDEHNYRTVNVALPKFELCLHGVVLSIVYKFQ